MRTDRISNCDQPKWVRNGFKFKKVLQLISKVSFSSTTIVFSVFMGLSKCHESGSTPGRPKSGSYVTDVQDLLNPIKTGNRITKFPFKNSVKWVFQSRGLNTTRMCAGLILFLNPITGVLKPCMNCP